MADRTLLPIWTQHIKDPKKKLEFKKYVLNSNALLDRLEVMVDNYIDEIRRSEINEDYSSPAWPQLQADRLGQLKSFAKIKRLLQRKNEVENNE